MNWWQGKRWSINLNQVTCIDHNYWISKQYIIVYIAKGASGVYLYKEEATSFLKAINTAHTNDGEVL